MPEIWNSTFEKNLNRTSSLNFKVLHKNYL